jgi:hypothetical protein
VTVLETPNRRLYSPTQVFGGRFRHPCARPGCDAEMVVPDPCTPGAPERLEEGQIWACAACMALHEYYLVLDKGVRSACVRLLVGEHVREGAEPKVDEFLEGK